MARDRPHPVLEEPVADVTDVVSVVGVAPVNEGLL
jgi:hypothetical protein